MCYFMVVKMDIVDVGGSRTNSDNTSGAPLGTTFVVDSDGMFCIVDGTVIDCA
jgi:hypothetical protein